MTALANSEASICTAALLLCEQDQGIESLDDATTEARRCRAVYDIARRHVLADGRWNFSRRFAVVEGDLGIAVRPLQFDHVYQLPADCLKVIRLPDEPKTSWQVLDANNRLYTSADDPLTIEYVADVEDPARFDAGFVSALHYYLASLLAPSFTNSSNRREMLLRTYRQFIEDLKASDAAEGGNVFWDDAAQTDWRLHHDRIGYDWTRY